MFSGTISARSNVPLLGSVCVLCRPLNMVCTTAGDDDTKVSTTEGDEDTDKVSATEGDEDIKLIDFDASAKMGDPCHLKFRCV